jgi:hypothetical protein
MIGYCGLVCSGCPALVATLADDVSALEQVAAQWREAYSAPEITAESVVCDGCTVEGRHCGHWSECEIRICGEGRGVANCAHCADYACERLVGFFAQVPDAQVVLEEVRASL